MQNIFEKFVSNLVFAAFIPSMIFVSLCILILNPLVPVTVKIEVVNIFGEVSIFAIAWTLVLSFILFYLRELVYLFYMGAFLPKIFLRFEAKRAQKLRDAISKIEKEILSQDDSDRIASLENQKYELVFYYLVNFPSYYLEGIRHDGKLYPTRFGNILKAAEFYCWRYGIDANNIWHRLVHVISDKSYEKIEEKNNQMFLVLNLSLLSLAFSIISFILTVFSSSNSQSFIFYLTLSFVSFLVFSLFYRLALPLAYSYANMYRSAFDLYRFDLLRTMKEEVPKNSEQEYEIWSRISEGFAVSECFGDLVCNYHNSEVQPGNINNRNPPSTKSWRAKLARAMHGVANIIEE